MSPENPILPLMIELIAALAIGVLVGYLMRKKVGEKKIKSAEDRASLVLVEAQRDGEAKKKELLLEAKDEIHRMRNEMTEESNHRRNELQSLESRLLTREEMLDRKTLSLEKKEERLAEKLSEVESFRDEAASLVEKRREELQFVSGLTAEEGKQLLLNNLEKELSRESVLLIKEAEQRVKDEKEKIARDIVSQTIQRIAADHVAETTVSVVNLPGDDMKGRIIGREGRNIRTLESLTGVDLIIDDTPEAVVLSCFDPIRREVARIALERLVNDGRIHPTRIEEAVEKARKEVDASIREAGEQAAYDAGVHGLHSELLSYLGRLKFRTSYGQNVLRHSVEVARVAGLLAQQLGADEKVARRAGLLHDIGKSIDHEVEGPHIDIGVDLAGRYRETEEVIHGIEAHHGDVEFKTVEAVLVQAADAISAARPGARRETLESYVKRLEKLEEIATSFDGVDKSYAVQAGREVRIIVKPEDLKEEDIILLARNVVKKIESSLDYPGQIKVNVIRETRAIEYAR